MKQSLAALLEVEVGLGLGALPQGQSPARSRKEEETPWLREGWHRGAGTERGATCPAGRARNGDKVGKPGGGQFRGL